MSKLTQSRLKELLHYDKSSGDFTWKVTKCNIKTGDVAGTISNTGYINIGVDGKSYGAHRLAFLYVNGLLPKQCVDHINGLRGDNRWVNLIETTNSKNSKNLRMPTTNTSGIVGVTYIKRLNKYRASIYHENKSIYLGVFSTIEEAAKVRKSAEIKYGFSENHGTKRKCYKEPTFKIKNTPLDKYEGCRDSYTQDRVKKLITYDPLSGEVTWNINISGIKKGSKAGSISTDKSGRKYHNIRLDTFAFRTHRIIYLYMTGKFPKGLVDHLNGDTLDNRWENLKDVTHSENARNCSKRKDNTSGYTGVNWRNDTNKWQVSINENNKKHNLGCFTNLEDAVAARKKAEVKYGFSKRHGK